MYIESYSKPLQMQTLLIPPWRQDHLLRLQVLQEQPTQLVRWQEYLEYANAGIIVCVEVVGWGVWVALVYQRLSRERGCEGKAPQGARGDMTVTHAWME